jgi:hypothetical protein
MTQTEALRLALEALQTKGEHHPRVYAAMTAIKAALEAKDEPVAYINVEQRKLEWAKYVSWGTPTVVNLPKIPLYTTPSQRKWVGLTDAEVDQAFTELTLRKIYQAIEAKLREKNT